MTPKEYTIAAERTVNHALTPDEQLGAQALGLMAEAGEVANAIKKHLYQNRPLNAEHILEECGDTLWSLANIIRMMGGNIETVMSANVAKLKARYPDGFPVVAEETVVYEKTRGHEPLARCNCVDCQAAHRETITGTRLPTGDYPRLEDREG